MFQLFLLWINFSDPRCSTDALVKNPTSSRERLTNWDTLLKNIRAHYQVTEVFLHNRFSFDREQTFHSFIRFAPTNVVCCCLDYRTIFVDRPPNNTTASSCLTLSFAIGRFVALFAALWLQEDAIPKNTENPTIHLARECRTCSIFVHFVVHTINGASVFVV